MRDDEEVRPGSEPRASHIAGPIDLQWTDGPSTRGGGAFMRIGLIASPFIPVPPTRYGGTELFVANLAESLRRLNVHVSVYANGESTVKSRRTLGLSQAGLATPRGDVGLDEGSRPHLLVDQGCCGGV